MRLGLLLPVAVIALDQISKLLVLHSLEPYEVIQWTSFLNSVLVFNTGVSFGLFAGDAVFLRWLLVSFAAAVSLGLFLWLRREKRPIVSFAVSLILGGALSNALDRVVRYAVVDFIDLHIGNWHWPAFNLADTAITVGVGLYIFASLRDHYGSSKLECR
jgi:signal peptidase II